MSRAAPGMRVPIPPNSTRAPTYGSPSNPRAVATSQPSTRPVPVPSTLMAATLSADHPAGLPARTSLRAMRLRIPRGVSLVPSAPSVPRSSTAFRRRVSDSWTPRTSRPTDRKVAATPMGSMYSDIDPHHLPHDEDADDHQERPKPEDDAADERLKQGIEEAAVRLGDEQDDRERKHREDPRRQLPLRGQDPDLPTNGLAVPEGLGHRVQDLGEVPSDLPLDVDGHHRPLEVVAGHPIAERAERLIHRAAQADLRDRPAELARGRLGDLLRHHIQGLEEAVPRPEGAGDDHEHVDHLGLESVEPAPGGHGERGDRDQRGHDGPR